MNKKRITLEIMTSFFRAKATITSRGKSTDKNLLVEVVVRIVVGILVALITAQILG